MAIDIPNTNLSANDKRILDALFDPETLPSSVARSKDAAAIDTSLPTHPTISSSELSELEAQQHQIVRDASAKSTPEELNSEILKLDAIIIKWPSYPSAYVNRAMLRRMKIEVNLKGAQAIFSAPEPEIQSILTDLSHAIHMSLPSESPAAPVSPYQARTLRTAYSHRAYLYLKAVEVGFEVRGLAKTEVEELASKDFAAAARYGDEAAREMSVRTNPYAKMCGAIVRNALKEEREQENNYV